MAVPWSRSVPILVARFVFQPHFARSAVSSSAEGEAAAGIPINELFRHLGSHTSDKIAAGAVHRITTSGVIAFNSAIVCST
jgi:nitrate/nitrite transporter NarK